MKPRRFIHALRFFPVSLYALPVTRFTAKYFLAQRHQLSCLHHQPRVKKSTTESLSATCRRSAPGEIAEAHRIAKIFPTDGPARLATAHRPRQEILRHSWRWDEGHTRCGGRQLLRELSASPWDKRQLALESRRKKTSAVRPTLRTYASASFVTEASGH